MLDFAISGERHTEAEDGERSKALLIYFAPARPLAIAYSCMPIDSQAYNTFTVVEVEGFESFLPVHARNDTAWILPLGEQLIPSPPCLFIPLIDLLHVASFPRSPTSLLPRPFPRWVVGVVRHQDTIAIR
jgi:hypothetical protein